ncbi:MAG: aminopeptidase [Acetivibrio ethanolgignens]
MSYMEVIKEENKGMEERYELATSRIQEIAADVGSVGASYQEYFKKAADFLLLTEKAAKMTEAREKTEGAKLKEMNEALYEDIRNEAYETSYTNPSYANERLGKDYGPALCVLYTLLRKNIAYAYEGLMAERTFTMELFIEIFNLFEDEDETTVQAVKSALYYFDSDYTEVRCRENTKRLFLPEYGFATAIIKDADLTKESCEAAGPDYLYYYGELVTENEIKTARYLNSLSKEKIEALARTYTEGFRLGFVNGRLDLSIKNTVEIRYHLGFERIVRAAVVQFSELGLCPTFRRTAIVSSRANRQYDYDHRYDDALYLDKALVDRRISGMTAAYEEVKEAAGRFAGPALIEVFGEQPFAPKAKEEALSYNEKQQKLMVDYRRNASILGNKYIKMEETSFTIIAYPIPEIGDNFNEIFDETVKVNTLDMDLYRDIQQKLIDVLDQGEYVHILGMGKNHTNLKVALQKLSDPEKETLFENCLADVNIPVGEVFTSPRLSGTNGVLHVSEVYLRELKYLDLELTFEDGKIADYTCKNFSEEAENKKFIKENIMNQQETLPIGEFAIGTNTTAYAMARKYGISGKLPILIAEKTGPHFAVGDTCFRMQEEVKTFGPDGKEMVAKDNEISILRKTEIEKAYFNCHTDITIPYDELGEISVYDKNGIRTILIKDGRFVLPGTEELNKALDA